MKHRILPILMTLFMGLGGYLSIQQATAQNQGLYTLRGEIVAASGVEKLPGATIQALETKEIIVSDKDGVFSIHIEEGVYTLSVQFLGYRTREVTVTVPQTDFIRIEMETDEYSLESVEIISTGFQEIPKERATGSFAFLNQELVDRRISTNILERLEDVTPGVIFNRNNAASDPISIRGRSTLFANTVPLIVIDNLPYEGPIENINPNDVASITVLRDAAAASIWGAQAGNGVIVITTKGGKSGQPLMVTLNSNLTVLETPDLFYNPRMTSSDFIDQETRLFQNGFYNNAANSPNRTSLSPTVETLLALTAEQISQEEADARIAGFRQQDFRSELEKHYYRNAVNQQYFLQVQGGGDHHNLFFSAGYDHNLAPETGNHNNRLTLNAKNDFSFLDNKLQVNTGIYLGRTKSIFGTAVPTGFPYDVLSDNAGMHLPIASMVNRRYVNQVEGTGLLDWNFVPLDEIGRLNHRIVGTDYRINAGINYKISESLQAQMLYQYWNNSTENRNLEEEDLFVMRNLINNYTQVGENGQLVRNIPLGGRLGLSNEHGNSHNLRLQGNYNRRFRNGNSLSTLAGAEVRDLNKMSDATLYYGYDDEIGVSRLVDYLTLFPMHFNPGLRRAIPAGNSHSGITDRYLSYFFNASYSMKDRYTISASARKDMSNLFGVEANMKGVPLWSTGAAWNISNESFYSWDWMAFMRLRLTYGYNGNVNKAISALTTVNIGSLNFVIPNLPLAVITNPPNPDLRWERIGIANLAMDFEAKNSRIGGSVEFYKKIGSDLIGESPVPPSNGILQFSGNFSETKTTGFDIMVNSVNTNGMLKWTSAAIVSHVSDEVVSFRGARSIGQYLGSSGGGMVPREGYPLFSIYSYRWGGLDPVSGNPLGYVNGELSDNYGQVINSTSGEDLVFHGSARPTHFGALRNDLSYKGWSLSINVTYRLGYYYRGRSVNYGDLLRGVISHSDYEKRWQTSGDELETFVPSMPQTVNPSRDSFYQFSSVLVEKGDHIRLQDIRLGYFLDQATFPRFPFRRAEIYGYANNLGIIWKASNLPLDPDFPTMRPLRSLSIGLRIDL